MKTSPSRAAIALVALAGLAACDPTPAYRDWFGELGASVDEGAFGRPTANNIAVQSGERSYVEGLSARFSTEVPDTVTFEFNSAQLDASAQDILLRQATWIRQFPEVRFRVYGHADAVGSASYNKALGLRRAQTVVNFLVSQGISRTRLEAMVSFGEERPLIYSEDRERRNRRAVTEVSGFVQNHPNLLDGKYAAVIYREYIASAESGGSVSSGGGSGGGDGGGGGTIVDGARQ